MTSSFSRRRRSYLKILEDLFFMESKVETRGLWSEAPSCRQCDLPFGNTSDHELFTIALSRRQCTRCECLFPLQERKFPVCLRSKRSQVERKDLKLLKELSGLSVPPDFSALEMISLKSPVRNHGESLVAAMSQREFHTANLLGVSGSPYTKLLWKLFPFKHTNVSMKFGVAERIVTSTSFFHRRARQPELGVIGSKRYCLSRCKTSSSFSTKTSGFLVSDKKITSGEHCLFRSLSLWIVAGFPKPQQFQLKMTKKDEEGGCENPKIPFPG